MRNKMACNIPICSKPASDTTQLTLDARPIVDETVSLHQERQERTCYSYVTYAENLCMRRPWWLQLKFGTHSYYAAKDQNGRKNVSTAKLILLSCAFGDFPRDLHISKQTLGSDPRGTMLYICRNSLSWWMLNKMEDLVYRFDMIKTVFLFIFLLWGKPCYTYRRLNGDISFDNRLFGVLMHYITYSFRNAEEKILINFC